MPPLTAAAPPVYRRFTTPDSADKDAWMLVASTDGNRGRDGAIPGGFHLSLFRKRVQLFIKLPSVHSQRDRR